MFLAELEVLKGIGGLIIQIIGAALVAFFIILYARLKVWIKKQSEARAWEDEYYRDDIFRELISELRTKTEADRVMIFQFHNGPKFLTGLSFKKISLTYSSRKRYITQLYPKESYQDVAMNLLIPFIKDLQEEEYILITQDIIPEKYENTVYITNADSKLNIHTKIQYKNKFVGFLSLSYIENTTFNMDKVELLKSTAIEIAKMLCQEDYLFKRNNRKESFFKKFTNKLKRKEE